MALVLINEISKDKRQVSIVYLAIYTLINYWFEHINSTIDPLQVAYKMGRESGNNNIAFQAAISYCYNSFLIGNQLTELREEMKKIGDELPARYIGFASLFTTVETFLDIHPKDPSLNNESVSHAKQKFASNFACIFRAYYFYEYDSAARLIDESKLLNKEFGYVGSCIFEFFVFYSGLVACSMAKKEEKRSHWLLIANENLNLLKGWSEVVPQNFENKLTLLEAEIAFAVGNKDEAKELFKEAIYLSKKHGYINEEALANERAGMFCIETNELKRVCNFFTEALKLYGEWGAQAKVRHVKSLYSSYIKSVDDEVFLKTFEVDDDIGSEIANILDTITL